MLVSTIVINFWTFNIAAILKNIFHDYWKDTIKIALKKKIQADIQMKVCSQTWVASFK